MKLRGEGTRGGLLVVAVVSVCVCFCVCVYFSMFLEGRVGVEEVVEEKGEEERRGGGTPGACICVL